MKTFCKVLAQLSKMRRSLWIQNSSKIGNQKKLKIKKLEKYKIFFKCFSTFSASKLTLLLFICNIDTKVSKCINQKIEKKKEGEVKSKRKVNLCASKNKSYANFMYCSTDCLDRHGSSCYQDEIAFASTIPTSSPPRVSWCWRSSCCPTSDGDIAVECSSFQWWWLKSVWNKANLSEFELWQPIPILTYFVPMVRRPWADRWMAVSYFEHCRRCTARSCLCCALEDPWEMIPRYSGVGEWRSTRKKMKHGWRREIISMS